MGTGRLQLTQRVNAQGATEAFPSTTTDTATHSACAILPTADGESRCLPSSEWLRFSDSSCSPSGAVTTTSPSATTPTIGSRWNGDACGGGLVLHELVPSRNWPTQIYDANILTGCTLDPFGTGGDHQYYVAGAELPLSDFAKVALVTE